jgi:PAS domain S-box-containing protein
MQEDGRPDATHLLAELAACRAENARLHSVIDRTDDAITIKDREGRYLYANPVALKLVNRPLDEIIGRTDADFFPPEVLAQLKETDQAAMRTGTSMSYEINTDSHLWGRRTHLTNKFPYYEADGELAGVVAVVRDITDRKRAEEALRESEGRFKGLVEASFDGVAIHENGVIVEANQALAAMFGYPLEAMIGLNGLDTAAPEYHDTILRHIREKNPRPYEIEAIRRDGTRFPVEMIGKDVIYQGRPARVSAFRDITERKQLEQHLRWQNERLQELDRLKSAFVGSVSHELRTPLTAIKGYAEFLEDGIGGELPPQQQAFVGEILQGAARLERLVDDLLDFARLESGAFKLVLAEADLVAKVRAIAHALRPQALDCAITLTLRLPDDPVPLRMDAGRIEQVLNNLVGNALKFTPPGGRVTVTVRPAADAVRVEVADTGDGIAPSHLPHLFDRFYQVDNTSTRQVGGTGLGLTISKALVEAHGGTIGVESTPGRGSIFWFTLPAGATPAGSTNG